MVEPNNKISELLDKNHPDVDYLRQADISLVLSRALAETFKAQPLEPKKYFAKYLLNYAEQKRKENDVSTVSIYKQAVTTKFKFRGKMRAKLLTSTKMTTKRCWQETKRRKLIRSNQIKMKLTKNKLSLMGLKSRKTLQTTCNH